MRTLLTASLLIASVLIGTYAVAEDPRVSVSQCAIGNVRLGCSEEQLVGAFGRAERYLDGEVWGKQSRMIWFTEAEARLVEGKLVYLRYTSAELKTADGGKVGDSEETIRHLYGRPSSVANGEESRWTYVAYGRQEEMAFLFKDGRVTAIVLVTAIKSGPIA